MEHTKAEYTIVEDVVVEATNAQMHELSDLQLAFVGGGVGEITPY